MILFTAISGSVPKSLGDCASLDNSGMALGGTTAWSRALTGLWHVHIGAALARSARPRTPRRRRTTA